MIALLTTSSPDDDEPKPISPNNEPETVSTDDKSEDFELSKSVSFSSYKPQHKSYTTYPIRSSSFKTTKYQKEKREIFV